MKKILIVLIFMSFLVNCFAQTTPVNQTPQTTQIVDRLKVIDAGSASLVGGESVIQLENKLSVKDYTVILTPIGDYKELYISVKNEGSFIVKSQNSTDGEFQYVIFLKKSKEILKTNNLKQK